MHFKCAAASAVRADRFFACQFPLSPFADPGLFAQSPNGADADAAAAGDTGGILQCPVKGGSYRCGEAPIRDIYGVIVLNFITDIDTPATENTLIVIPDNKGIIVNNLLFVSGSSERWLLDSKLIGVFFQETGSAFFTGDAVHGMVRENQFQIELTRPLYPFGIGVNYHPITRRVGTGCRQTSHPLHLNNTDPAGTHGGKVLTIAEMGYFYAQLLCSPVEGGPLRYAYLLSVYCQCYRCTHRFFPSVLFMIP